MDTYNYNGKLLSEVKVLEYNPPMVNVTIMAGFYMSCKVFPCVIHGTSHLKPPHVILSVSTHFLLKQL